MAIDDDKKHKGNPRWVKGFAPNPGGKPKGTKNGKTLNKVKNYLETEVERNPIDELIKIADQARFAGNHKLAAEIWSTIQEYIEPKKKPVETAPEKPLTPKDSKEAAEATHKLLQELENGSGEKEPSDKNCMAPRTTTLQTQTSPEKDISGNSSKQ